MLEGPESSPFAEFRESYQLAIGRNQKDYNESESLMTRVDPLSQMIEAACESAIKRAMSISDVSPRRLFTAQEAGLYLALSKREVYSIIANKELAGVRHGRRLMIDIRDIEQWIDRKKSEAR